MIAVPLLKSGGVSYVYPHFGRAPYFALADVSGDGYRVISVEENPHLSHEHGKSEGLINYLLSRRVEAVIVSGVGRRAFENLRGSGIKVYYTLDPGRLTTLEEVLEAFVQGKLKEAQGPLEH
ncbi:MAG: NifB/NifX family molybdenum-iron cluster-binding protein [Zestosphaera sp.]